MFSVGVHRERGRGGVRGEFSGGRGEYFVVDDDSAFGEEEGGVVFVEVV